MSVSSALKIAASLLGPDIHVVGGAVRDRLLGRPTSDIDLTIPPKALSQIAELTRLIGGSSFPLDEERGITRIDVGDIHLDVSPWQGKTLEDDLDRRDLSVNALAVPLKAWLSSSWRKNVIDRHGGLADLKKRRLSPLSANTLKEDPLRILRTFRFAAELDFSIPPEAMASLHRLRALLKKPAPERVREEMLKIFSTPRAYATLLLLDKAGALDIVFKEAPALRRTAHGYYGKGGVLTHTLDSVKLFENVIVDMRSWFPRHAKKVMDYLETPFASYPRLAHLKWALLLHDIGKPQTAAMIKGRMRFFEHEHVGADKVPDIGRRFRWSGEETARYAKLVRNHMRPGNLATQDEVSDKAIHRFFRDLGDDAIAMLLVSLADHLTYLSPRELKKRSSAHELVTIKMVRRFYENHDQVLPPRIVSGTEIMRVFGLKPSPLIGRLLEDVRDAQSEGKVTDTASGIAYLRGRIEWHQQEFAKTQKQIS